MGGGSGLRPRGRGGSVLCARGCVGVAVAGCLGATPLLAQSNDEIQSALQWNLSTPGARSLALGGAFLALADDATAAYANPAGLSQLVRPELSVEGRGWDFTSRFVDHGHQPATGVTGIGVDQVDGLAFAERHDRTAGVSFASYVQSHGRLAWALYRHQLADFEASLVSHGPFAGLRQGPRRAVPARSRLRLDIEAWGGAAAWRLRDDVSVGATFSWQRFHLGSLTERFDRGEQPTGDPLVDSLTGGFFGPADFLPENLLNVQTLEGRDEDLAGSLGVLWRPLTALSVGAVFRRGGHFGFQARYVHGPRAALRGEEPGTVEPSVGGDGVFHAPDSFGAGVAWRPRDDLVVAFDWDRVQYSSLSDDLVNLLLAARGEARAFTIADADELHLGAEYQAVTWRLPVSFRLGAWHDPDHRLRYGGGDAVLRTRFARGEDQLHLCGGLGVVVGHAQVDLAFDASKLVDTVSLSTVARF